MKFGVFAGGFLAVILGITSTLHAGTIISLNFGADQTGGSMGSTGTAGLLGTEPGNNIGSTAVTNWNNLSGNNGSTSSLTYDDGTAASGVNITWASDNTYVLPNTSGGSNTTASTTMMKGYLDNENENAITVSVSNLPTLAVGQSYAVVLFSDGNNETEWRRGNYSISTGGSVVMEDGENVDFNSGSNNNANGLFQLPVAGGEGNQNWWFSPNNSEANTIIFEGITSTSFTLTATPTESGTGEGELLRAPINGVQIVAIPEPATLAITVGIFAFGALRRNRH